jgi:hypothetical protein
MPKHQVTRAKRTDQTFQFMAWQWNITAIEKYVAENKSNIEVEELNAKLWIEKVGGIIRINKEHAMQKELGEPGILVQLPGKDTGCMIIDGWHRCYKASLEEKTFEVYVLPFHLWGKFLTEEYMLKAAFNLERKYPE